MADKVKNALHILLAMAIAAGLTFWAARRHDTGPQTIVERVTDTLVIHDTLRVTQPVPVKVRVVDSIEVPVPIPGKTDTIWMQLPREEKTYQDSSYRAVISGYLPRLDTMEVFPKTVIITTTERIQPPRWSWGVQAGVGASKDGLTPYVGVGIQYRLQFRRK